MTHFTSCGALLADGRDCHASPVPDAPVNLCLRHLKEAADYFHAMTSDPERVAAAWSQVAEERASAPEKRSIVYFVRFGDRVKIGTTTNPRIRFGALPFDEILATFPGDRSTEQLLHRRFASLRLTKTGEWFRDDPQIRDFITRAKRNASLRRTA